MAAHMYPRDVVERRTVAGLFPDRTRAEQAIDALKAAGFTGDQIGVALRDRTAQGVLIEETGTQVAEEAATTGALGGGLLGGLTGLLIGIGALVIPASDRSWPVGCWRPLSGWLGARRWQARASARPPGDSSAR
jgi:hypothetical protein